MGGKPPLSQDEIDKKIKKDMEELKASFDTGNNTDELVENLKGDIREKNGLPRDWEPEVPDIKEGK